MEPSAPLLLPWKSVELSGSSMRCQCQQSEPSLLCPSSPACISPIPRTSSSPCLSCCPSGEDILLPVVLPQHVAALPFAEPGTLGVPPLPSKPCRSLQTEALWDGSGSCSALLLWLEFYCCSVTCFPRDFFLFFFFSFCRLWMQITPNPPRVCWGSWVTCCLGRAWTCCWQQQQQRAS